MMNGTLALVGSGEYLPAMEPVDRLLLSRIAEPRVVCLPTAAGTEGATTVARWSRMGVEHFNRLGAAVEAVDVVDRASAEDQALADRIRAANFVYLSGGRPDYLYATLRGTAAFAALVEVLERGGVVAGCSAGAMIWGEMIPTFPTLFPFQPVFNYLPRTIIIPHFDEMPGGVLSYGRALLGRRTLVGIEGNTALVCSNKGYTVAGSGGVAVWDRRRKERYTAGQAVAL